MSQAVSADGHGIARQFDENLSEAAAIVGQYVQDGDENRPFFEHSVEAMANQIVKAKLERMGRQFKASDPVAGSLIEQAVDKVRSLLKWRVTDEATAYPAVEKRSARTGKTYVQLDPVYLDFEDLAGSGMCPPWSPQSQDSAGNITHVPAIYFAVLDPERDRTLFKPGKCEAIAVYADPNDAIERRTVTWKMASGGTTTCEQVSDWDIEQYHGIVRTFGSYASMKQAHRDLRNAMRVITAPPPTDAHDDPDGLPPVDIYDDVDLDEIDGL